MIPHFRLHISREDRLAVAEVLQSVALVQGRVVAEFERAVADHVGVRGGVAVSSGTAALHLALLAMGIGKHDEVILPSYLCVAPMNAVHYTGAVPVLADVSPQTGNISAESVARTMTSKTKAVIVPHMMGQPAALEQLLALELPLLEDCAQAIGAGYKGRMCGSFGRVSICSFYATKVFTSGEGGMVLSDDEAVLAQVRDLRDYDEKKPYRVRFNYKMTDMQAALGLSQFRRLPSFIEERRRIAEGYDRQFRGLSLGLPEHDLDVEPIWYRYILRMPSGRDDFIGQLERENVICRKGIYEPLHCLVDQHGLFPQADRVFAESVSIPIYPGLTEDEQQRVVEAIIKCLPNDRK